MRREIVPDGMIAIGVETGIEAAAGIAVGVAMTAVEIGQATDNGRAAHVGSTPTLDQTDQEARVGPDPQRDGQGHHHPPGPPSGIRDLREETAAVDHGLPAPTDIRTAIGTQLEEIARLTEETGQQTDNHDHHQAGETGPQIFGPEAGTVETGAAVQVQDPSGPGLHRWTQIDAFAASRRDIKEISAFGTETELRTLVFDACGKVSSYTTDLTTVDFRSRIIVLRPLTQGRGELII